MAEVDAVTKSRQSFAEVLRKHRIKGMGRAEMLKTYGKSGTSGFGGEDPELDDKDSDKFIDPDKFKTFVDKMYSGKMDTARDRQQRRQIERRNFTQQQRSRKLDREAAFADKMDRQRKESAAKFGVAHEVETPGLDRIAAMQGAAFGDNTATAGSVLKFDEQRDISPSSAPHGVAERAAGRAGDVAGARAHREAKLKAREERGGILKQEQRGRLQEKEKEVARQQAKLGKAQRRRDKTAKITAKEALHRAKEAKNARKKGK